MNEAVPLEIERKFLIDRPTESELRSHSSRWIQITQVYLKRDPEGASRRIRSSTENGVTTFHYNEKRLLHGFTRSEREWTITKEDYEMLTQERDPQRHVIKKVRWCVPFEGHVLELDLFPFWEDRALLEIELSSEEEAYSLPSWIHVIKEVTSDRRYFNTSLAAEIPMDDIR